MATKIWKFDQLFHETGSWKKQTVIPNVDISPELATKLLQMNGKNRPVRHKKVKEYAETMKSGHWKFNGDVIRISTIGLILDGQHRLLAIVESGTTQRYNIQSGLEDEVFDSIDIGAIRTGGDTLSVAGHSNANAMAGAAKIIMAYQNGDLAKMALAQQGKKLSNQDVLEFVESKSDVDLLTTSTKIGQANYRRFRVFSPATYIAFLYLFSKKDKEKAIAFFEALSTGENISKKNNSMIYILRSKLITVQNSKYILGTVDKYALLIKSWNAYRKGREIGQLSWQNKEEFPQIK